MLKTRTEPDYPIPVQLNYSKSNNCVDPDGYNGDTESCVSLEVVKNLRYHYPSEGENILMQITETEREYNFQINTKKKHPSSKRRKKQYYCSVEIPEDKQLSTNPKENLPSEPRKTLIALLLLATSFFVNVTSLCLTHDKLPDRNKYEPLPDVLLDTFPEKIWALQVSEYFIIFCTTSLALMVVMHKHRFIIARRLFLLMFMLYLYRSLTMFVTVLPIASKTYHCEVQTSNTTFPELMKRVFSVMSGFGLSINGKHVYCGDFIYSGHTVILVMSALFINEYTPKKLKYIQWFYWILAWTGIILLVLSHGHYTIDIIIAYFITTRLFWTYHTIANNECLKIISPTNYLSRCWWFLPFLYFEDNVKGVLPNEYSWFGT